MTKTTQLVKVRGKNLELTNLEKILFPSTKITKKDVVEYYFKIAKWMLPYLKDRPISMFRYPEGIDQEHFVQKNISSYFPKWIPTASIERKDKTNIQMLLCNNVETLVYIANLACITPHIWLSKKNRLYKPDRMIFDLDPPKNGFALVAQGAKALKKILEEEFDIKSYVMTTGSRGVHVVVSIKNELEFDLVRAFAKKVASILVEKSPFDYTMEMRKEKRKGRLFLDYMRNAFAQTAVAPYALRAIEKAPVATPIEWSELKEDLDLSTFNIQTVLNRIEKKDPWEGMKKNQQGIKKFIKDV